METPAGTECRFYYEDFQRGAERQECRAKRHPRSATWMPTDCARCPVPGILKANGSPHLELRLMIRAGMLGFGRRLDVDAWCVLHGPVVGDPHIGCSACNEEADALLRDALD